jgi:excisionase family DNA binding protein
MDFFDHFVGRNPFPADDPRHVTWNKIAHDAQLEHAQAIAATEGLTPGSLEVWVALSAANFDLAARVGLEMMTIPDYGERSVGAYKTWLRQVEQSITDFNLNEVEWRPMPLGFKAALTLRLVQRSAFWTARACETLQPPTARPQASAEWDQHLEAVQHTAEQLGTAPAVTATRAHVAPAVDADVRPSDVSDLVTLATAADHLSVHEKTLKRWHREGRIELTQVGKNWKVSRAELARVKVARLD